MNIRSLMKRRVETLPPRASATEAARVMRDARVGSVIVAVEERPVGVVTDRDLVLRVLAPGLDPARVALAEVMSPRPVFVAETAEVSYVLELMRDLAVRRVPVVDASQTLVGVVSLDDLILSLASDLGAVAETIRKEM